MRHLRSNSTMRLQRSRICFTREKSSPYSILSMPKLSRWLLLRTGSGRRVHEALEHGAKPGTVKVLDSNMSREQWYADSLGDYAMAVLISAPFWCSRRRGDVQNKDFVQVAPILPVSIEGAEAKLGTSTTSLWGISSTHFGFGHTLRRSPQKASPTSLSFRQCIRATSGVFDRNSTSD